MAIYYASSGVTGSSADGLTGADTSYAVGGGNVGTEANPFLTAAAAQAVVTSGDTLNWAGRWYTLTDGASENIFLLTDKTGITHQQWSGQPPAAFYGCRSPSISDSDGHTTPWVKDGGTNCYTKTLATGMSPVAMGHDYDLAANIDTLGRHKAFFIPAGHAAWSHWSGGSNVFDDNAAAAITAVAAAGTATQGAWDYNSTTGLATIIMPNGADPNTKSANGVFYVNKARSAIRHSASGTAEALNSRIRVDGLIFRGHCDAISASPAGSPLIFASADSGVVTGCTFDDHGLHAISWGSGCSNNTTAGNVYRGMGPNGANSVVYNASGTTLGVTNNVHGCRSARDIVYANSLLDHAGLLLGSGGVGGFYAHSDGQVQSVECIDCQVIEYKPASGTVNSVVKFACDNCATPSNLNDPETYPYIIRQTNPNIYTIKNGTVDPDQTLTQYMAWISTRLDFSTLNNASLPWAFRTGSKTGGFFFDATEFVGALTNGSGSGSAAFVSIGAAFTVRDRNTTYYDMATSHSDAHVYAIMEYNATPNGTTGKGWISSQSLMGFRTSDGGTRKFQVVFGDNGISASFVSVTNGAYLNIDATHWADDASRDTTAEWIATIDAAAVNLATSNPLSDATGATAALKSSEQLRKRLVVPHARVGANHRLYGGNYGSSQYPLPSGLRQRVGGSRRGTGPR